MKALTKLVASCCLALKLNNEIVEEIADVESHTANFEKGWGIDMDRSSINTKFGDQYITTCAMWRPLIYPGNEKLNLTLDEEVTMYIGF